MTTTTPAEARVAAKAAGYDPALVATTLAALARRQASSGKTCRTCSTFKRLNAFAADVRNPDGLDTRCRECDAKRKREARTADPV